MQYIAIDLKSFYASVECAERGLDPLHTNLVVADASRTEKTICLAVSPSLKAFGISGRARLFEVVQRVKEINAERQRHAPGGKFGGSSFRDVELRMHPEMELDYIVASPRMALYMEYSTRIYQIYLKYIAPEDIHVYSIDEVFIDATPYLNTYRMTARELAEKMIADVLDATGITATAGIGTNLYLCKIAMDVMAKKIPPDENGVRIAELDEISYRKELWDHKPITDFWRIGRGYEKKLKANGLFTMGDVARCSLGGDRDFHNEDLLFRLFGINAELLIDHAWGYEPCTVADIKAYKPESSSISAGQVLSCPYNFQKGRLIVREMTDLLVLDLVKKDLETDQMVLTIGYDVENLTDPERRKRYRGAVKRDHYGRSVPKHAHGTAGLERFTSSTAIIMEAVLELYDKIVDRDLLIRRINVVAGRVVRRNRKKTEASYEQLSLFDLKNDAEYDTVCDAEKRAVQKQLRSEETLDRERRMQEAMLEIKQKFGKNAILKGNNLEEGATSIERNRQIGGHKA